MAVFGCLLASKCIVNFSELIVDEEQDKNRCATSLNDRRLYDRRPKAATCCRQFPSLARPKAVINSILTPIITIPGQTLAYIPDVLMGFSFGSKDAYVQLQTIAAEKQDYIEVAQPYSGEMATMIYDASGISEL